MTKVYFYCPSYKMGGEQMLFIRCAKYLSTIKEYQVSYIDYEDGFSSSFLYGTNVKLVKYSQGFFVKIEKYSVIIIALSYIDQLMKRFGKRNDIHYLLWSLQPFNLVGKIQVCGEYYSLIKPIRIYLGKQVLKLYKNNVIQFMDYNNYFTVHKALRLDIEGINYLPIPIDNEYIVPSLSNVFPDLVKEGIRFMWLSRIDRDKEPMLLTIMNELNVLATKIKVSLIIVGDGNSLEKVKSYAKMCIFDTIFTGRKSGVDLNQIIDNQVDIGIAMGTSALEMSKRGKPVIMTTTISTIQDAGVINNYILLHQEYGYSLDKPNIFTEGQDTFDEIVKEILRDYPKYAYLDYEYTKNNHSMEIVGQKLHETLMRLIIGNPVENYELIRKIVRILHINSFIKLEPFRI